MCYQTSSDKSKTQVEQYAKGGFHDPLEYQPYFQQSGFTYPNLQIIKMDEPDKIYPASWGLVPEWGMNDVAAFRKKYNTLNAKMETLLSSNTYKHSALDKRCLIIVDGFFEPQKVNGVSVPNYCYIPTTEYEDGRDIFSFAGVFTELDPDEHVYSCSIITTAANDFFEEIHNVKKRMPLVLDEELRGEWFNDGLSNDNVQELMAHGFTSKTFNAHPVSRDLYKRNIDTNKPYILEKDGPPTLFD